MQATVLIRPRTLYLATALICALGLSPFLLFVVRDRAMLQYFGEGDVRANPITNFFLQEPTRFIDGSHCLDLGLTEFHYETSVPDIETLIDRIEVSLAGNGIAFARLPADDGPRWRVDADWEIRLEYTHGQVAVTAIKFWLIPERR